MKRAEAIKDTVVSVMQDLFAKKACPGHDDPQELLKKVLTKKELGHIKINYFKKGVLGLFVDSSSWLYKFSLQKKELLDKLIQQSSEIKDIKFRIGEIK
jgi:hypothetical protein